jgi:hypothetical protein
MNSLDNCYSLTNSSGNALDRSGAHIANSENARFAGGVNGRHFLVTNIGTSNNKPFGVKLQAPTQPDHFRAPTYEYGLQIAIETLLLDQRNCRRLRE